MPLSGCKTIRIDINGLLVVGWLVGWLILCDRNASDTSPLPIFPRQRTGNKLKSKLQLRAIQEIYFFKGTGSKDYEGLMVYFVNYKDERIIEKNVYHRCTIFI